MKLLITGGSARNTSGKEIGEILNVFTVDKSPYQLT